LPISGTYTIYISPDANSSGTVSLQVLTYANASASVNGAAVSATIPTTTPGQIIAATFSGTAGQSIYINGTGGNFGTTLTLYDPTGDQIATGNTFALDSGSTTTWISPTNLSTTGTYTLYITPDPDATGNVTFQIISSYINASTGVNGIPTVLNIPSSTPGKIMAIMFSSNAGSSVSMLGITGFVGGTLAMYDPDGIQVATGIAIPYFTCSDDGLPGTCPQILIAPVTIPLTGTYTLYIVPGATQNGTADIQVLSYGAV
jgi:hypothetical protein